MEYLKRKTTLTNVTNNALTFNGANGIGFSWMGAHMDCELLNQHENGFMWKSCEKLDLFILNCEYLLAFRKNTEQISKAHRKYVLRSDLVSLLPLKYCVS